jgi:hypothetical protein
VIQLPIITKIIVISALFLNAPYQKLNCQNYVETVLARAVSTTPQEIEKNSEAIRYSNDSPSYFTRNHFPAADWIPNNIQKHYVSYSPLNTKVITKIENKEAWCETQLHDKKTCQEKFKKTWVVLRYIPVSKIPQVASEIPSGSILFIVKPTKYTLISHMGFAIQKNNILYLRAASSLAGKVTDYDFMDYLKFEPKILGITVLVPEEQGQ